VCDDNDAAAALHEPLQRRPVLVQVREPVAHERALVAPPLGVVQQVLVPRPRANLHEREPGGLGVGAEIPVADEHDRDAGGGGAEGAREGEERAHVALAAVRGGDHDEVAAGSRICARLPLPHARRRRQGRVLCRCVRPGSIAAEPAVCLAAEHEAAVCIAAEHGAAGARRRFAPLLLLPMRGSPLRRRRRWLRSCAVRHGVCLEARSASH
jgi:hypothetical protein